MQSRWSESNKRGSIFKWGYTNGPELSSSSVKRTSLVILLAAAAFGMTTGDLRLHAPEFDLDLLHTSGDRWSGRIHRKGFDSAVILTRPSTAKSKPWFVGTWKTGDQSHQRCIHIAEQAPDEFVGWTDSLTAWGHARFGPHVPKPPYSLEIYGDLVKVSTADDGNVSIELNTFGGTCCSHLFVGIPKDNGTVMKAVWPPGPNQAPHRTEWKKMPGNTCIVTPPDLPSPPRNSDSRDPKK